MSKTKILFFICCFLGWGVTNILAQQGTVSAGGSASGSNGSVTYTIGQTNYSNNAGSNGKITEGVQQPYEFFISKIEPVSTSMNISLFPNPATEFVVLQVSGKTTDGMTYELYDAAGNVLQAKNVESTSQQIAMGKYASATYYLKVTNKNKDSQKFKIIKN